VRSHRLLPKGHNAEDWDPEAVIGFTLKLEKERGQSTPFLFI
jgi:hypothetical protein